MCEFLMTIVILFIYHKVKVIRQQKKKS